MFTLLFGVLLFVVFVLGLASIAACILSHYCDEEEERWEDEMDDEVRIYECRKILKDMEEQRRISHERN